MSICSSAIPETVNNKLIQVRRVISFSFFFLFLFSSFKKMPTSFLPTRAFQAYQIFAANTNVGKTIFATGLCRAAAIMAEQNNRDVFYVKPVQTGFPIDSDER